MRLGLIDQAVVLGDIENLSRAAELDKRIPKLRELRSSVASADSLRKSLADGYRNDREFSVELLVRLEGEADDLIRRHRRRYEQAQSDASRATALRASISQLGAELVSLMPDEARCPLCGEDHGKSGLLRRIGEIEPTDEAQEAVSAALQDLAQAQRTGDEVTRLLERRKEYDRLGGQLVGQLDAKTVGEAIQALGGVGDRHAATLQELEDLEVLGERLEDLKLTPSDAIAFADQLRKATKLELLSADHEEITDARRIAAEQLREVEVSLQLATGDLVAAESEFESLVHDAFQGLREPDFVLPLIRERQSAASRGLESIEELRHTLEIDEATDLSDLKSRLDSAQRTLVASIGFERLLLESSERLRSIEEQLEAALEKRAEIFGPRQRIEEALETLDDLLRDQGISQTIEGFLQSYKSAILAIFRAIHAPAEFADLMLGSGDDEKSIVLVRDDEESTLAKLSEISTGQRAALALSIFLALNRSVKNRLNLIMIDDPVANVDDMNSLAFLDFLRNLAMSGTQVLFATADESLARLFEMKFHPLGDQFQVLRFTNTGVGADPA